MDSGLFNVPITFNLTYQQIKLEPAYIGKSMGYPEENIPDFMIDLINEGLNDAESHSDIQAGYIIFEPAICKFEKDFFTINDTVFKTGKIIALQIKKSSGIILFAASVGTYFDNKIKSAFDLGDSVNGLIIDTIGSELVEKAGEFLENKVKEIMLDKNLNITNRLSPGYCDWDVFEQFSFFKLLPKSFCGISLTDSAMMLPMKSITGVIGYGANVIQKDYPCNICGMEFCYKRKLKD